MPVIGCGMMKRAGLHEAQEQPPDGRQPPARRATSLDQKSSNRKARGGQPRRSKLLMLCICMVARL
jgi:hypothetical protein